MTEESPSQNPSTATGDEAPQPGKATKVGATAVLALIAASLLWYFAADRLTPHTTQARVQAFVVPVAAEVAGKPLASADTAAGDIIVSAGGARLLVVEREGPAAA